MIDKKYSVGTKVIYNPSYSLPPYNEKYRNQIGVFVGVRCGFPTCKFSNNIPISTCWDSLTPLKIKNQQLEFAFMEEQGEKV